MLSHVLCGKNSVVAQWRSLAETVSDETAGSLKGREFSDQLRENPLPRKEILTVTSAEERPATAHICSQDI